jgi:hypothetical protein
MDLADYEAELLALPPGDLEAALDLFVRAYEAGIWPPPEAIGGGESLMMKMPEPRQLAARIRAYLAHRPRRRTRDGRR